MQFIKDIANLFFPKICLSCDMVLTTEEKVICSFCIFELPKANYSDLKDNPVEKIFFGRIKIESATALLLYAKKGNVQKLIHNLKYSGHQEIGVFIGNLLGNEIIASNRFRNIDGIIPVPLHKNKLKSRGYNQVTKFGEQLSKKLKAPYVKDILIRKTAAKTQSKKIRFDRWKNVTEMFFVQDLSTFKNKHVLLIDDIITTGATLEACCNELLKIKGIKISIAVMAFTK